ncbi:hypothetical protein DOK_11736 [gamma proteobacterium BDW918]|nr:hypothetical protein DOK_11736 [gamma proteobacterium BDW918]
MRLNTKSRIVPALFALAIAGNVSGQSISRMATQDSDVDLTDLSGTNKSLSTEEKSQAKKWSLTESDWLKYKEIMSGPRGIWSPGLDPITALGVSETDPAERRRYADIWMEVETRRIELELAFERERMAAGKRLHGDQKRINNDAWIEAWKKKQAQVTSVINLFVDASCLEECSSVAKSLLRSVGNKSKLDIYFKPGTPESEAAVWATYFQIDPKVVATRHITLNVHASKWKELKISTDSLPQVWVEDVATGEVTQTHGN